MSILALALFCKENWVFNYVKVSNVFPMSYILHLMFTYSFGVLIFPTAAPCERTFFLRAMPNKFNNYINDKNCTNETEKTAITTHIKVDSCSVASIEPCDITAFEFFFIFSEQRLICYFQ